jgi:hypothetical protein
VKQCLTVRPTFGSYGISQTVSIKGQTLSPRIIYVLILLRKTEENSMSYYTISYWEADEWTDEMEAIAKDKFGPMIMEVGASSVNFVQTGAKTMCVVTKYKDEATGTAALAKISEIRGQAASTMPIRMVSDVKGSAFVSM